MQALGTGLLVLFFVIGVVKTCGSFTDLKKPEHAVKLFVRFILAKAIITQGMELMTTLFGIVQSGIASIMTAAGVSSATDTVLPDDLVSAIVGGHAYRRTVYYHNVLHYDYERVRQILQALYVHGYRSYSAFDFCGRAYAERRQEFSQKLLRRLFGGCGYRISLHHFLTVCIFSACCGCGRTACHNGMGVHR